LGTRFNQVRAVGSRQWALLLYGAALATGAGGLATGLLLAGERIGSPYPLALLVGLALLAERGSIQLTPVGPNGEGIQISVSSLVLIFTGVVFGPLAAMLVAAAGLLVDFGRPFIRWVIWTGIRTLTVGAAALAAMAVGGRASHSFAVILVAVAAAAAVDATAGLAFGTLTTVIRGSASPGNVLRTLGPVMLAATPLHAPVIAVLVFAYRDVSPLSVALFVLPAFAAQRLYLLYREQRETSDKLTAVNDRLARANLSFATALVATLDARDQYTAGHSAAVAIYARDIARRMSLSNREADLAHLCGLVHDIGKVGLPAGLLEKPGSLTLDERRLMESHSAIGERILAKVDDYAEISSVVRHHHERVDGNGYPDGLVDEEIPLLSRIIAVADAYNAMTSDRPYREAMPSRVARLRLAQAVESQFDTSVVAAFEAILAGATEDYRRGSTADFALEMRDHSESSEAAQAV
jgi:putative nucleotidyltransferase with HDIG domain